ncbi:MAG: DegT/DnrJ/EryC1/StrS family aminotransferase [Bacteroidales bacterium]|nr:DegT/DnrJ/EryC1/StrS family aminotransferase [Bacteroidales bacterium]
MVDIQSQYQRLHNDIDAAIKKVLESGVFINGEEVRAFSDELAAWLGVPHVIPCGNGTDALQIALMALGLEPGDEVITTNFTFISTVEVLALLRLKPVLVDVDPDTFTINPDLVRRAITPKTRAIIPVHLFGQPADMDPLLELAKENHLYIIEDNAQSLGAKYIHHDGTSAMTGSMGDIGTTSFFPTKPLGGYGDGGALTTRDDRLAEKIRMIYNHGARVKYYHDLIGVNSRLDTLQAAILRVNLQNLDQFIRARQQVAARYNQALAGVDRLQLPRAAPYATHVYHQYTVVVKSGNRNRIQSMLKERDIPSMIYYPVPLSLQKAFTSAGYHKGDFPVTEYLCDHVLSLPIHTEMEDEQITYITGILIDILNL